MVLLKKLSATMEDYLETILLMAKKNNVARVKDIARKLCVKKPSVNNALKQLSSKGLINYQPYEFITLTPEGKRLANKLLRRRDIIKPFLTEILLLEDDEAEKYTCRLEHAFDGRLIDRLACYLELFDTFPDKLANGADCLNVTVHNAAR